MERALAAIGQSDTNRALLREAATLAAGADAELLLLSILPEEEYNADVDVLESIEQMERVDYPGESGSDLARELGEQIAQDALSGIDIEYEIIGQLGFDGESRTIISVAEEHECDHIFVTGSSRSPAGKALFGDMAQSVVLNFDGPVTVWTE